MASGRRGRPSYDDYARRVAEALRFDLFALEDCTALAQLPGVQATFRNFEHDLLPLGSTLRAMLDRAVADIETVAARSSDPVLQRIAVFLGIWYRERGTVVRVAQTLHVSRSTVVHAIQPRAIDLVTKRFLELAWNVQALV